MSANFEGGSHRLQSMLRDRVSELWFDRLNPVLVENIVISGSV